MPRPVRPWNLRTMPGPSLPIVFAQAPAPAGAAPAAGAGTTAKAPGAAPAANTGAGSPMLMIPALILLFYMLVLRPGQDQERKRKALLQGVKKNDRVLTTAGIYGTVVSVNAEADRVVMRVDDEKGLKLEFTRASIAKIVDVAGETEVAKVAEKAKGR